MWGQDMKQLFTGGLYMLDVAQLDSSIRIASATECAQLCSIDVWLHSQV